MKEQIEMHCPKCGSANILTDDLECYSCGHIWYKRGGKRPNAGAKKQEPKKAIGVRVRVRFHSQLVKMVKIEEQRLLDLATPQNGV